ncbi:LysR family transcriptional regulator [Bradyrhizobium sp. RDT46]|uniref:LysR family transcriptional regulator n=1 Tax=Bradyrhizobium sp. RDT46 TaxID=3341829 RepID=UPI0035C73008
MTVELRHVRYVLEAAERGSFRAAARALGVQQSAVSRRIRDVEDELGVSLFNRDRAGVRLTDAGKRFVARARRAMTHIRIATDDAGCCGRGEVGVVRIGIFSSLAGGFLADLLRIHTKRNPGVRTDVVEGGRAAHISGIQRLQLDIAFLTGTPSAEGCESMDLWSERVFVAVPSSDEIATADEVRWDDLRDRRFVVGEDDPGPEVHDYLVRHLTELGDTPNVERHAVGRDNLMHLVALGQGLTLTSEAATAAHFPGVAFVPLSSEILRYSAIWLRRNDNPALRRLLSLARTMGRQWPAATVAPEIAKLEARRLVSMLHARSVAPCASSQIPDRSP